MTVRQKLAWAFGALAALVLIVAALSVRGLGIAHDAFVDYVEGVNARAQLAAGVRSAVDSRAVAARNLVLVATPADTEIEKQAVLKAHEEVGSRMNRLRTMVAEPGITAEARGLVKEISDVEALYGPVAMAIVDLALRNEKEEATRKINAECRPLLVKLVSAAEAYAAFTDKHARIMIEDAATDFERQRAMLIAACVVAFIAAGLAGVLIARSLQRSLGAEPDVLSKAAKMVAAGDLSSVQGAERAPADSVLASLSVMQLSLSDIVRDVRNASDSVATGSSQIATGNIDLSQRTEEQASALQHTSANMDELGTTIRNNADHAKQASTLADKASAVAVRGGEVVGRVVATMGGIAESSRKISDIIGTVDSIAFQTNILALNAAVEAARAGEQGRGFAVVASEVRTLAQRSAEAAKEIKLLIGGSVSQVQNGTSLVDQAGATMQEIVTAIKQVNDIVAEISAASEEQRSGVSQVADAVAQIDQVTQQNAALVEESAAAAASLQQQAKLLVQAVSIFKLGHADLLMDFRRAEGGGEVPKLAGNRMLAQPALA